MDEYRPAVRTVFVGYAALSLALPLMLVALLLFGRPLASVSVLGLGGPLLVVTLRCLTRRADAVPDVLSKPLCRGLLLLSVLVAGGLWGMAGFAYAVPSTLGAFMFLLRENWMWHLASRWGMSL